MQHTPYAAVVPPAVTLRSNQLVAGQLLWGMESSNCPIGVFERAIDHTFDVECGMIVILRTYRTIEGLVKVGASRKDATDHYR